MDISSIGTQYLNSQFVPLSSSSAPAAPGLDAMRESSFTDLLKKAQNAESSKEVNTARNKIAAGSAALEKNVIDKNSKLYQSCQDLETFLIKNLIKSMRDTVQKTNLIDSGFAGEMYEDMLYDEYAKTFSKNANFGFAEMAYRQLAGSK